MYSPTLKGRVKMIVSPAARLPSTPCIASAMPAPATPSPAISGSSSTPRFCSAMMRNSPSTRMRTMRTSNRRRVSSSPIFSSIESASLPTQRPT